MKQTAWADLPNAKHIDRILADLKKNPDGWYDARVAAWDAARNAARTAAWNAAWDAARDAARDDAWYAARNAILALIAYDDCIYLLDEKPEHVQMLGLLGNQQALLLYPACLALQNKSVTFG